jgi:AMP phosphorylase
MLLELGGMSNGVERAKQILESGKALKKFKEIVAAQGGDPNIRSKDIKIGKFKYDVAARKAGYVSAINNKDLVRIARLAGAPKDKGAGILLNKKRGHQVEMGETLYTVYAENEAKLERAADMGRRTDSVSIEGMLLAKIPSFSRVNV